MLNSVLRAGTVATVCYGASAQGYGASAQDRGLTIVNATKLESIELPNLQAVGGGIVINNVPEVSYINFESLEYVEGCSETFPLKPALAANDRGLKLEKKADQYKDKGVIDQAKYQYKVAHEAYLEATEKEKKLSCTDIDVFRKNAERVQGKLNGLPNQEL
ncbi:hypothetical protein N9L24_00855 [Candidatus Marinamargulisbacteria bacterium]|nr:hypothetical protein [Candidatus Marinamargulisbacteria bacterium]